MTVQPNSLAAFDGVDLTARQAEVLAAIAALHAEGKTPSDADVAARLGWTINRVTPRRGELVDRGLVLMGEHKPGPFGAKVATWFPAPEQLTFWQRLHEDLPR